MDTIKRYWVWIAVAFVMFMLWRRGRGGVKKTAVAIPATKADGGGYYQAEVPAFKYPGDSYNTDGPKTFRASVN